MKIAMIGPKGIPATFGGVETAVEHLACSLVARGHQVIVYCRANYTARQTPRFYKGIELRVLPSIPTKHLDAISHSAFAALDLPGRGIDLVHFHSVGPGCLAPLTRLGRWPTVVTIHAADWLRDKWSAPARFCLRHALNLAVKYANVVTTVSLSLADFLADIYGIKPVYIPNGVTVPCPLPAGLSDRTAVSARRTILFVGRLVPEKDVHVLIQAFAKLTADNAFADAQLLLAGDSYFSDPYVRKLHKLAGPNTHFLGFVSQSELAKLYGRADLCVLPSHLEGMPLVLLEAAAHACPVIAADIQENRNTLDRFARYFSPRSVQGLHQALADTLNNLAPARRLALAARDHVRRSFSWDKIARQMEDVYLCAIRQAQPRR